MSGILGAYDDSSEEGDDAPSILAKAAAAASTGSGDVAASAGGDDATKASPSAASSAGAGAAPASGSPNSDTGGAGVAIGGGASSAESSDEDEDAVGAEDGDARLPPLPPSPTGEVDAEILERVRSLHELRKRGKSIRDHIQGSRDWSNPYILERVIKVFEINQYGSNYPKELFDPSAIAEHPSDYFDAPDCERPPPPPKKQRRKGT